MNPFLYLSHILLTFVVFTAPGTTNAFGFSASPANYIYPGKRPQSSISSSIAEDLETGEFKVATGAAGGSRIITATLQSLHFTLDQGLTPNASVHTSRWHDQLTNVTYFELPAPANGLPGFNNGTIDFLTSLGCAFSLFFLLLVVELTISCRQCHLRGHHWKHISHHRKDQWHLPSFQRPTKVRWSWVCILDGHSKYQPALINNRE